MNVQFGRSGQIYYWGLFSGLGRMNAHSIWAIVQDLASGTHPKPSTLRINEKLETLSVDEDLDRLALASVSDIWTKEGENYDESIYTPLQVFGCLIVRERVKKHMERLLVQAVGNLYLTLRRELWYMTKKTEEEARWMTVDAARGLCGSVKQLGKAFKRVYGRQHLLRMMIIHILLVWSRMKAKLCSLPYRRIYINICYRFTSRIRSFVQTA